MRGPHSFTPNGVPNRIGREFVQATLSGRPQLQPQPLPPTPRPPRADSREK
jgi:hypothetical protein